jgi:DNA-binding transcriptional MerR regulator
VSDELEAGYGGKQVCDIVGITYRQLDYWARQDLIRPSIADAKGSGSQRLYSFGDIVELKVVKRLIDGGVALQKARKAIEFLRDNLGEDLASADLVLDGPNALLVRSENEWVDLFHKKQGQGAFNFVKLTSIPDEVTAAISELHPVAADGPAAAAN